MLTNLTGPVRGLFILMVMLLSACTGLPAGIEPVTGFDIDRYTGRWYEIARLDHSFERGLSRVTAEYTLKDDGSVRVINRGFNADKGEWKQAEGRARFVGAADRGHLKVSFFGPFYGAYVIYELDHDGYQYAFITSYKRDFLWLLSRTPEVDEALRQRFVEGAQELGFATDELIWVEQADAL
jgi:apolipoprotein D and lipocalin family protein